MQIQQQIIKAAQSLSACKLGSGKAGNVSGRGGAGYFITPTGVAYATLDSNHIVEMDLKGNAVNSDLLPSSEWRLHQDIYLQRSQVHGIVHTHSPYATAIACTRQGIPAFHYMVAVAGGNSIRCADYATFGTGELSAHALQALQDRQACLLANHGVVALGYDVAAAFELAQQVEELARQYVLSRQFGEPVLLDDNEMATNLKKFATYGKQGTDGN
ncbi:MAG: class II aldolase/adducin family protein [Gammaproteobacteria bacterium]